MKVQVPKLVGAIFEKLLPARWWRRPIPLTDEQLWTAFAAPENPQSKAVLHVAQDKFVTHMQSAANQAGTSDERLRSLDRAMAIADFMTEVDGNFNVAKEELKRREALKQENQNQQPG